MQKIDYFPALLYCNNCRGNIEYINSSYIYGKDYGMIYICKKCDSFTGVHEGTNIPLGLLANKEQRDLRKEVHNLFDKKWNKKIRGSRTKAYKGLGKN